MLKAIIKVAITLLLLFYVLNSIELEKLLEIVKNTNLFWLFLAFLAFNLSKIISSFRLNYYFKEIDIELDTLTNLKLYYIGMFYNLFLPGGIGGDGYKAYLLHKKFNQKLSLIIQALLFDRISGLIGLIFLASFIFLFSKFAIYPLNLIAFIVAILIYPLFIYLSLRLKKFITYLKTTTLLGLWVQIVQLICALFIIISLHVEVSTIDFLVLFLISSVVSVAPVSIGGVGVRELTFLYGLEFLEYEPNSGIAFSFLFFFVTLISSLIGVAFIWKKSLGGFENGKL